MLQLTLATLHLIALGLGLGAVINRGVALREVPDSRSLARVFRAVALWGIAAGLWIITGLWRYLGGIEKSVTYYNGNSFFAIKMVLLGLILALEVWPMLTLIRWRIAIGRGAAPGAVAVPRTARAVATISHVQSLLIVLMVLAAVSMARGYSL